jgi:H+-transporting ATPase
MPAFPSLLPAALQFTGKNTFFGKTATMLQGVQGLGHLQKILLRIMAVLVGLSLALCLTCLIYLLVSGESVISALSFTVVLLVASIPIAIEIVRGCCRGCCLQLLAAGAGRSTG